MDVLLQSFLPLGLAFIMLAIGLDLRPADFTRLFRRPAPMLAGLVNQMLLLPCIGLALALTYDGRPEFAVGLMILAASPGGITSNLLTVLAGGNGALSVSMTALTSLIGIVSLPLILGLSQTLLLGAATPIAMPIERIMLGVLVITGLPIALGMGLRLWKPAWAGRLTGPARRLATVVFAIIVAGAFVGQMDNIVTHFIDIGLLLLILNLATMALGWATSRLLSLERADGVAITLECGLQNAALSIFVAVTLLGSPPMVVPAITYALIMNVTAALFLFHARRAARLSNGVDA